MYLSLGGVGKELLTDLFGGCVIVKTTSHSTKPTSGQVAGYPAKAGIQIICKSPRSGTTPKVCPLRGILFLLDSRFRGNDGLMNCLE
jgi:hypothetical protein